MRHLVPTFIRLVYVTIIFVGATKLYPSHPAFVIGFIAAMSYMGSIEGK